MPAWPGGRGRWARHWGLPTGVGAGLAVAAQTAHWGGNSGDGGQANGGNGATTQGAGVQ